ncbi:MAG TPA: hypothetical protein VKR06_09685 [Ktedonosporobacter sp.]|nr:hypothetical protein [Ktedonosporobacter sp.]
MDENDHTTSEIIRGSQQRWAAELANDVLTKAARERCNEKNPWPFL